MCSSRADAEIRTQLAPKPEARWIFRVALGARRAFAGLTRASSGRMRQRGPEDVGQRRSSIVPRALSVFAFVATTGAIHAQELLRYHGNDQVGALPEWLDSHGDMNGDGIREYLWGGWGLHPLGGLSGVALFDGATGDRLWFQEHDATFTQTTGLASIDDIDGDGFGDVAVIAGHIPLGGRCTFLSGTTGAPIGWFEGGSAAEFQGVWGLDDVDGDGVSDVLVQWTDFSYRVVSGSAPYPVLYDVPGASGYGGRASRLDDVDGDGVDDYAVRYGFFGVSPVHVHSAVGGAILYSVDGAGAVSDVGDIDGDGIRDWCANVAGSDLMGRYHAEIAMFSGATGTPLWRTSSPWPGVNFGNEVAAGGDVNGDGYDDIATVNLTGTNGNQIVMHVLDSRTGAIIRDVDREAATPPGGCPPFGFTNVRILGDLDGDGYAEFAGADRDYDACGTLPGIERGRLYIFKGGPGGEVEHVCDAPPNSTGVPARLRAAGAAQVGSEHFALQLHQAPVHEFTQLAFGPELGPGAPYMQLGAGHLCLDPSGARRAGAPRSTGPAGGTWFLPGWTQDPAIASSWAAGTTWVVQAIFRDTADPAGANTSSAIRVNFF